MEHHAHHAAADVADVAAAVAHRCQMSMLFTWNTKDLCLVFRWWHVSSPLTLILSLLAVVALGMGYEYLRALSRSYEARLAAPSPTDAPLIYRDHPEEEEDDEEGGGDDEESSRAVAVGLRGPAARRAHIAKALFYAVQVFYSFFIMLLFMTYNGWVMLAVAVGAFLGFVLWGGKGEATKSVACH